MKPAFARVYLPLLAAALVAFGPNAGLSQVVPGDRVQNARPAAGEIRRAGLGKVDETLLRTSLIPELALPDAAPADDGLIDIPTARAAALNRAHRLWGGDPTVQSVIPVFDAVGKLVAYDVDLALQPGPWSYAQVAAEWQGVLRRNDQQKRQNKLTKDAERLPPPQAPGHRFGSVTISANFDAYPVRCAGRGVSNYYASAWVAQNVASQALSSPSPRLVAAQWLGPWERAYRFEANGKQILVEGQEPWGWYDYEPYLAASKAALVVRENEVQNMIAARGSIPQETLDRIRSDNRTALRNVLSESNSPLSTHYIPGYNTSFERLEWHYGCSPTAAAMVLNYWENVAFYGRLNTRFFKELDAVEGDVDCHVSTLQLGLKILMATDDEGSTRVSSIYPGMLNYANSQGYSFSGGPNWIGSSSDWHWNDIVSEIDAGYPFVFSALPWPPGGSGSEGHSVAAVGYDDVLMDVLIYTTWRTNGDSPQHVHHSGSLSEFTTGHAPRPGGAAQYDVKLISPDGFQTFGTCGSAGTLRGGETATITWENFGRPGHHVSLYYSTNGGNVWTAIGTAPDNGSYIWNVPNTYTLEGRVHIIQYSSASTVSSSDGSYGDFTVNADVSVTVQPDPPGAAFSVDGIAYTSAHTFRWVSGDSHTLDTSSPQSAGTGIRYVWHSWSDGGEINHIVAPTTDTLFTPHFYTQYYLTVSAGDGVTVDPPPPGRWYSSGYTTQISATPDSISQFTDWSGSGSGSYTGANNPAASR